MSFLQRPEPPRSKVTDPAGVLLARLETVRSMEIRVFDPASCSLVAEGGAKVTAVAGAGSVELLERGWWRNGRWGRMSFANRLRVLRIDPWKLEVARWRRGGDYTALVQLVGGETDWTPVEPFTCGPDHYEARIYPAPGTLQLEWSVAGPSKRQRIVVRYAAA